MKKHLLSVLAGITLLGSAHDSFATTVIVHEPICHHHGDYHHNHRHHYCWRCARWVCNCHHHDYCCDYELSPQEVVACCVAGVVIAGCAVIKALFFPNRKLCDAKFNYAKKTFIDVKKELDTSEALRIVMDTRLHIYQRVLTLARYYSLGHDFFKVIVRAKDLRIQLQKKASRLSCVLVDLKHFAPKARKLIKRIDCMTNMLDQIVIYLIDLEKERIDLSDTNLSLGYYR